MSIKRPRDCPHFLADLNRFWFVRSHLLFPRLTSYPFAFTFSGSNQCFLCHFSTAVTVIKGGLFWYPNGRCLFIKFLRSSITPNERASVLWEPFVDTLIFYPPGRVLGLHLKQHGKNRQAFQMCMILIALFSQAEKFLALNSVALIPLESGLSQTSEVLPLCCRRQFRV